MSLPKNILFHGLKGSKGWSEFFTQTVDVARVTHMKHRKRLFKIFDRDCDYTLEVSYRQLTKMTDVAPTFVSGSNGSSFGMTFVDSVKTDHIMTVRYKTENDVVSEINQINTKQRKLKEFQDKQYSDLLKQFPEN